MKHNPGHYVPSEFCAFCTALWCAQSGAAVSTVWVPEASSCRGQQSVEISNWSKFGGKVTADRRFIAGTPTQGSGNILDEEVERM